MGTIRALDEAMLSIYVYHLGVLEQVQVALVGMVLRLEIDLGIRLELITR